MRKIRVPKFLFLLPNKHSGIPENTAELSLKNGKGFPHYITKDYVEKLSNYFNEAIIPEKIFGYSYAIDRFSKKKPLGIMENMLQVTMLVRQLIKMFF